MTVDRRWDVVVESLRRGGGPPHTLPSIAAEESFPQGYVLEKFGLQRRRDISWNSISYAGRSCVPGTVRMKLKY